jgi:hypothetical protein
MKSRVPGFAPHPGQPLFLKMSNNQSWKKLITSADKLIISATYARGIKIKMPTLYGSLFLSWNSRVRKCCGDKKGFFSCEKPSIWHFILSAIRSTCTTTPRPSGTTGPPKGVTLTHYNLVANITQLNHPGLLFFNGLKGHQSNCSLIRTHIP